MCTANTCECVKEECAGIKFQVYTSVAVRNTMEMWYTMNVKEDFRLCKWNVILLSEKFETFYIIRNIGSLYRQTEFNDKPQSSVIRELVCQPSECTFYWVLKHKHEIEFLVRLDVAPQGTSYTKDLSCAQQICTLSKIANTPTHKLSRTYYASHPQYLAMECCFMREKNKKEICFQILEHFLKGISILRAANV